MASFLSTEKPKRTRTMNLKTKSIERNLNSFDKTPSQKTVGKSPTKTKPKPNVSITQLESVRRLATATMPRPRLDSLAERDRDINDLVATMQRPVSQQQPLKQHFFKKKSGKPPPSTRAPTTSKAGSRPGSILRQNETNILFNTKSPYLVPVIPSTMKMKAKMRRLVP
jgi:hypothetical protein